MTILNILHFPDNKLRQKGANIEIFDIKLKEIAQDMLQTMYKAKGSDAAVEFLIKHEDVWTKWVSSSAAKKIKKSL